MARKPWPSRLTVPLASDRADQQSLVEAAEDLGHAGARPHVHERRLEERGDVTTAARPRLVLRLPRPRRAQVADHPVLAVDGRILDVPIQLDEVAIEEHGHRDRRPALAVLLV